MLPCWHAIRIGADRKHAPCSLAGSRLSCGIAAILDLVVEECAEETRLDVLL